MEDQGDARVQSASGAKQERLDDSDDDNVGVHGDTPLQRRPRMRGEFGTVAQSCASSLLSTIIHCGYTSSTSSSQLHFVISSDGRGLMFTAGGTVWSSLHYESTKTRVTVPVSS